MTLLGAVNSVNADCGGDGGCRLHATVPGALWCAGARGYDDLRGGAGVRILDESSTIVAAGQLSDGWAFAGEIGPEGEQLVEHLYAVGLYGARDALDGGGHWTSVLDGMLTDRCHFEFALEAAEAAFYTVEVAQRAGPTYSFGELRAAGWRVELTLG